MNKQRRTEHRRRGGGSSGGSSPKDFWRTRGPLPEVEPIEVADDVAALLRSLGEPPLARGGTAGKYFESVAERAAYMARVLAMSADLLAEADRD